MSEERRCRVTGRRAIAALLSAVALAGTACGTDRPPPTISPTATTSADPLETALAVGLDIYTQQCLTCHGAGEEGELAPSMREDLLDTFSSCADQNEFVTIGGDNWPEETYGDDDSPLGEYELIMAGYRDLLTPGEVAAVNFWIRVELAGVDEAVAAEACGIARANDGG